MNFGRVHPGEWIASACGLMILVGLSLPWYGDQTGLEQLSLLDLILIVVGVAGLLLPIIVAVTRTTNVPIVLETLVSTLALATAFILILKFVWSPGGGLQSGFYLGLGGTVLLTVFGWRSTTREH